MPANRLIGSFATATNRWLATTLHMGNLHEVSRKVNAWARQPDAALQKKTPMNPKRRRCGPRRRECQWRPSGHHGVSLVVVDSGVEHRASTVAHALPDAFQAT